MDNRDTGSALILALMLSALLAGLGMSVALGADTERRMAANATFAAKALFAAHAGVDRVVADLSARPQWDMALSGVDRSAFADATQRPTRSSGEILDLTNATVELQTETNAAGTFGANTPVWRLFAWGQFRALSAASAFDAPEYVAVWVADDPSDVDGSASADSNGIVTIHSEAWGPGGARRVVEATIARLLPAAVRVISLREIR
jgi:Tfp pilus assembly protein PilX